MNGFNVSGMLPSQQGVSTPGSTTPEGGTNWDLISTLLGQGAQAFSAQDPTSWQHQLGGAAEQFGQSKIYGKAMTKADKERSDLTEAIKMLAGGGIAMTPKGMPGPTSMKVDSKGEMSLGYTPDRDFFGLGPLSTGGVPQGAEPEAPVAPTEFGGQPTPTGGAGGQDVFSPFYQALQGGSQQQIW